MKHVYSTASYVEASAKLDQVCGWLEGLGINYSRTRVGKYKILFSTLAKHQLSNNLDEFHEKYSFPEWVNAAYETAELVRMYEGLNSYNDVSLNERLKDSLKGHELFVFDNDDRSGRDFSFELSVAAKFARQRYPIDFGHDADLKVQLNGGILFLECKRLKSAKKIQRRIKDGLKQLHKRYVKAEVPSYARGILVLSINKILNTELGLLEAENDEELGNKAFAYNARFIDEYKNYWQKNVDKRTLGAAVILDAPGVLRANNQLITCHEVTMNNSVPPNTNDHSLLLDIAHNVFAVRA